MSSRTRSPGRISAALALFVAAILAILLLDASLAAAETPPLAATELHAHAGPVSLVALGLVPVRSEAQHKGLHFRLRDLTGTRPRFVHRRVGADTVSFGERAFVRSATARRRARRRVRDARDEVPFLGVRLLPFVLLIAAGRAVTARVSLWTDTSDIRLPAERGPPSASA